MVKKTIVMLTTFGLLFITGFAFSSVAADAVSLKTIPQTSIQACNDKKEGDACFFIEDDIKHSGLCAKEQDTKMACKYEI